MDNITNLKESDDSHHIPSGESLQPQLNREILKVYPTLTTSQHDFIREMGMEHVVVGGVWMDVYPPHLWCYNFSRFLRLKSSGSNKKSVGEKIQICGFFGLTKMSLPNMEHLLKKKQNKKQMDVFEESKLRSQISCILLGLPFENPTVTHLVTKQAPFCWFRFGSPFGLRHLLQEFQVGFMWQEFHQGVEQEF